MGLVVNRPSELEVSALIQEFPALAQAGRVYAGGPVSKNALLFLCRGNAVEGTHNILEDVYLAKDLDMFKTPGLLNMDREIRCFLGYAGWAPGQLETEIKAGAWALMPSNSRLIFDADTTILWQDMMRRMGGQWSVYGFMPPDPSMN